MKKYIIRAVSGSRCDFVWLIIWTGLATSLSILTIGPMSDFLAATNQHIPWNTDVYIGFVLIGIIGVLLLSLSVKAGVYWKLLVDRLVDEIRRSRV